MTMTTLQDLIPDVEVLVALAPEELAEALLTLASTKQENGMFHPNNSSMSYTGGGGRPPNQGYKTREAEVQLALSEAWNWLRVNSLIVPAPGTNGQNGWMVLSRRARNILQEKSFNRFKEAAAFPKSMLHSSIADKVWLLLARGDLDEAVFAAFKAVESL